MATRVKTRETKSGEIVAYSELAIRNNASAVDYCRTSAAALSGSTAGQDDEIGCPVEHTDLPFFPCRHPRTHWHPRVRLLLHVRDRPLGHDPDKVRGQLAKVFHQPTEPADHRVPRRDVHLRALLDVPLRDGSCILRGFSFSFSVGLLRCFIPIN